ncbi:DUF2812 domain-containing protein [Exiguobacterium sp. SL-9]|uniref:DUF2812 domain-containing protein n=1 Tax=Exiguobacterium sp. SL-9 TaxID=2510963 RepID=UPI001039A44E|nr:DUF2812 domain-containing protein [Exiguobacterium sp. SL-9]TCI22458.1 DUF2812 domain-containing protein [Exiguobacterium sp. SL-9]
MTTKTIYRVYVDYEKEEQWLNEMAEQGWLLERFKIGRYVFSKGEPGAYMYRIELLEELPNHPKSTAYLEFLDEMEIEVVDTSFRWIFLRKRTENGPFHLYSDFDSMIAKTNRVLQLYQLVLLVNIIAICINVIGPFAVWVIWPNLALAAFIAYLIQQQTRKLRTLKGLRAIAEQD